MSISDNIKKRGRPATGTGTMVGVRLQPAELIALDGWISGHHTAVSRPEALRQLSAMSLSGQGPVEQTPSIMEVVGKAGEGVNLPPELKDRVAEYFSGVPFFTSEEEAAIDLIERGLASFEDREEIVELDAGQLVALKEIADGKPLETLVFEMLDHGIRAWRTRAEQAIDPED